jgi:hypothetical protein
LPGPVTHPGQHDVGVVDLVADAGEVGTDGSEVGAAADAVLHEPGGHWLMLVVRGAGAGAQLLLQRLGDGSGLDELD